MEKTKPSGSDIAIKLSLVLPDIKLNKFPAENPGAIIDYKKHSFLAIVMKNCIVHLKILIQIFLRIVILQSI